MYIAKIIGYLFVIAGCSGLGIWYSRQLQNRMYHIKEMIRILDITCSEIQYCQSTLPECCVSISEKTDEPYKTIFLDIWKSVRREKGESFDLACKRCLTSGMEKLPLKEEREIFIRSFEDVGFSDSWIQRRSMERGRSELSGILERDEDQIKNQSKLAVSLGTMGGILLVLIML